MTVPVRLRRPLVVFGVVLSLMLGAATIRAAAQWTAATSPLAAKPPSVESLQAAIVAEQERSAALRTQLDQLTSGSADLTAALEAARARIADDSTEAGRLRSDLATAKARLAALEASIRQARAAITRRAAAPTVPAGSPVGHDDDAEDHTGDDGG